MRADVQKDRDRKPELIPRRGDRRVVEYRVANETRLQATLCSLPPNP